MEPHVFYLLHTQLKRTVPAWYAESQTSKRKGGRLAILACITGITSLAGRQSQRSFQCFVQSAPQRSA
eukprot:1340412-Amphidinium_carterae.1